MIPAWLKDWNNSAVACLLGGVLVYYAIDALNVQITVLLWIAAMAAAAVVAASQLKM